MIRCDLSPNARVRIEKDRRESYSNALNIIAHIAKKVKRVVRKFWSLAVDVFGEVWYN